MNVLDLFSGIGGFSLGLERAGMRTVAFCEIEPYCQAVLRKHWPRVPIHDDIQTLHGTDVGRPVDVVCGGFPCQPFSSAARGRNRTDQALWPEMARIIAETKPAWVCAENVDDAPMALHESTSDLVSMGYSCAVLGLPAAAVDADHIRHRAFILGHANGNSQPGSTVHEEMAGLSRHRGDAGIVGETHGISRRMDRLRSLGNAVVPQIVEVIGRSIMEVR